MNEISEEDSKEYEKNDEEMNFSVHDAQDELEASKQSANKLRKNSGSLEESQEDADSPHNHDESKIAGNNISNISDEHYLSNFNAELGLNPSASIKANPNESLRDSENANKDEAKYSSRGSNESNERSAQAKTNSVKGGNQSLRHVDDQEEEEASPEVSAANLDQSKSANELELTPENNVDLEASDNLSQNKKTVSNNNEGQEAGETSGKYEVSGSQNAKDSHSEEAPKVTSGKYELDDFEKGVNLSQVEKSAEHYSIHDGDNENQSIENDKSNSIMEDSINKTEEKNEVSKSINNMSKISENNESKGLDKGKVHDDTIDIDESMEINEKPDEPIKPNDPEDPLEPEEFKVETADDHSVDENMKSIENLSRAINEDDSIDTDEQQEQIAEALVDSLIKNQENSVDHGVADTNYMPKAKKEPSFNYKATDAVNLGGNTNLSPSDQKDNTIEELKGDKDKSLAKIDEELKKIPAKYPPRQHLNEDLEEVMAPSDKNESKKVEANRNVKSSFDGKVVVQKKKRKANKIDKNKQILINSNMKPSMIKPPADKSKEYQKLASREANWDARLTQDFHTNAAQAAKKNYNNDVKEANKYIEDRKKGLKLDVGKEGKRYNHPKEVKLSSKSKVDAVGLQSQLKDIEAFREEFRKLQKEISEEVENTRTLKETLQDYEHQKIKLEAQVRDSGFDSISGIAEGENMLKRKFFSDDKNFALWKLFQEIELRNESLNDLFDLIDENKDQILTKEEIKKGLLRTESKEVVDKVFKVMDENTDGVVSKTEFVSVMGRLYLNYKELKEILDGTDFRDPLSIKEKNLDLEQRIEMERERNLKQRQAEYNEVDHVYGKEILRLLSLEQKGKAHNEEMMQRAEDFNERLKEMERNKEEQYDQEMRELKQSKKAMISEFEKEKARLEAEIKNSESDYNKVLTETINNKEMFFSAEKLLEATVIKERSQKELESKLNARIIEQYRKFPTPKHTLKEEIDAQCKNKLEFKKPLYKLLEEIN